MAKNFRKIKEKVWSIVIDPDNDNHIFVGCHTSPIMMIFLLKVYLNPGMVEKHGKNILDKTFPNYLIQSLTLEKRLGNLFYILALGAMDFFV